MSPGRSTTEEDAPTALGGRLTRETYEAAARGDALGAVLEHHRHHIAKYLRHAFGLSDHDIEDVTQDIFETIVRRPEILLVSNPLGYLITAAGNHVRTTVRRSHLRDRKERLLRPLLEDVNPPGTATVDADACWHTIRAEVPAVDYAAAYYLVVVLNMTQIEAGCILGMSRDKVKRRVVRTRKIAAQLRDQIEAR